MLPFSKFLKELSYLNFYNFKYYGFVNSIDNRILTSHSFSLIHRNPYSVISDENKRFPISEISNVQLPSNYDPEEVSKIVDEIHQMKSKGRRIPDYMKLSEIGDLFECGTYSQRLKFLKYLFKREKKKLNETEKNLQRSLEYQKNKNTVDVTNPGHIQYGLGKNTLLLKTWRRSVLKYYEKKLSISVLFGQKIVLDLSYDEHMMRKEKRACASQLRLVYSRNRYNPEPYDMYFCNANPKSHCVQYLHQEMPDTNHSLPMLYEQSYLDLFPKEDLVYLSPHASETLKTYDHKAIYIIGAFVDTMKREHVSLRKAEEEGIKSYSLPLDDYILWGRGSKSLSIDQAFSIMQTMRDTGDWKEAFKYVPTRKLRRIQIDLEGTQSIPDKLFVMSN